MDEVTSSLDNDNAKKIIKNVLKRKDGIKIFVIHDEFLKTNFDEIINIRAVQNKVRKCIESQ